MVTFNEITTEIAKESGYKSFDLLIDDMISDIDLFNFYLRGISRAYAEHAIDEAIDKTEICCNNFHPTITLKQLVNIKNNLQ